MAAAPAPLIEGGANVIQTDGAGPYVRINAPQADATGCNVAFVQLRASARPLAGSAVLAMKSHCPEVDHRSS
jgi:hypothetical protein